MTVFGSDYSLTYDALYYDKDYESECDFLEAIFRKYSKRVKTILDLGCGTGGHALVLARRGYEVVGVDRSVAMLDIAKEKAKKDNMAIKFYQDDITTLDLKRTFDAVIAMFAVMGYQISNDNLASACATARRHLKPGGIFFLHRRWLTF
jgi:2-polyprenyl-3-methyl-5-hydroxy-6-metoxy-1,4-benzoquinol methylase